MDNPTGRVVSLVVGDAGKRAIVDVEVAAVCPRCAAGKGCGAGLFAGRASVRRVEATIPEGVSIDADDVVEISLAPDSVLRAACIVYGLPLLGAVTAAAIAYGFGFGDGTAAGAALFGLGGGLAISRSRLRKTRCLARFVPSIERRLGAGAGAAP